MATLSRSSSAWKASRCTSLGHPSICTQTVLFTSALDSARTCPISQTPRCSQTSFSRTPPGACTSGEEPETPLQEPQNCPIWWCLTSLFQLKDEPEGSV